MSRGPWFIVWYYEGREVERAGYTTEQEARRDIVFARYVDKPAIMAGQLKILIAYEKGGMA